MPNHLIATSLQQGWKKLAYPLISSGLMLLLCGSALAKSNPLPVLDNSPVNSTQQITPITDLTGGLDTSEQQATPIPTSKQSSNSKPSEPTQASSPVPTSPSPRIEAVNPEAGRIEAEPEATTLEVDLHPATQATPSTARKARKPINLNPFDRSIQPISYSPLPGIAIFPVVKHGNDKIFGDLPLLFAREYALRMEMKVPETKIYHPIYTVDELRMQGMGHVYDQVLKYYIKAGRPEPAAMDYLLKRLGETGHPVSRVIFVEADLDFTHPAQSSGPLERIHTLMMDSVPKHMKYFVNSRLQVFDAETPGLPIVWGGSWRRSIQTNQFMNATTSVYADSDSQQAFARLSRSMSREILLITPKKAYMSPVYDISVQGQLVQQPKNTIPNFTEMPAGTQNINNDNRQAIQRILQRQNGISP